MSDHESNYGELDYQDYADSFAAQRELEADEADHEREAAADRLHRDDPIPVRETAR